MAVNNSSVTHALDVFYTRNTMVQSFWTEIPPQRNYTIYLQVAAKFMVVLNSQ